MRVKLLFLFLCIPCYSYSWGFFAHQQINKLAVFTLPPQMLTFYKRNIVFLTENAVVPDKRRYAVKNEAPRHYIDLDVYGVNARQILPKYWKDAVAKFTEDTLMAYGVVPWHINFMKYQLTEAFKSLDAKRILNISSDIGHYIGDANVPLHTTENYNGQLTGQHGIHGFWESRLPEMFFDHYDFFVGPCSYLEDVQGKAWKAVYAANDAKDSVLAFERELNHRFSEDKKYSYEERGGMNVRVYSKAYATEYHQMLKGQVERQLRASVKMVGDIWYSAWVDAGQPDLNKLIEFKFSEKELQEMEENKRKGGEVCTDCHH